MVGDKYGVTGLIGEGGMGAVYEAEHLAIGRLVAVKVLHPKHAQKKEAVARLQHEARVAGTIGHPNICEIYDMGRLDDGSPYLVMERLHGETLAERIQRDGTVPYRDLLDIVVQVLSALVAAHDKGVIHRDLKPDNIFLSERAGMHPVAKLLDFGISKAQREESSMDLTRTGMVMGTPYYMAPEQARGQRDLDGRVDLWAVGVILYEALSGRRPFVARNYNALLMQILTTKHKPLGEVARDVPGPLCAVVDRALAKMREDRFQNASEFLDALTQLRRTLVPSSPPVVRVDAGRVMYGRRASDRKPEAVATPPVAEVPRPAAAPAPVPLGPVAVPAVPQIADPQSISESLPSGDDATFVLSDHDLGDAPPAHDEAPTFVTQHPEDDTEHTVVDPPSFLSDSATTLRGDSSPPKRK